MLALFGDLSEAAPEDIRNERVACLVEARHVRIERIVSRRVRQGFGTISPGPVVVLAGSAGLRFEGEAEVKVLSEGDYVLIPARVKHRVEWTSKDHATIWLAVHYPETE